ncbi:MAG: alpha/beta fold hydrolase [Candidatus Omnitrophica bacterium]|nr:alpha/beta fold hydrolase [Candidatus Omnitrophota bacterium]MCB9720620.1 alpha/beta fold hydrolase [Candidatus Omnitrophota bacterium]
MTRKPRHIIILIHGIGGNKTHFGHMVAALRRVLQKEDPAYRYVIHNLEYETGHDEKMVTDFAVDLAVRINRIQERGLDGGDKISLIMHSQGGLVGAVWMFQSLKGNPDYSPPEVIEQLDSFITLGTPFWGAKIAVWGAEMKALTRQLGINIPVPFGKNQLDQMSFGSDMIFDFRQALIDSEHRHHIEYLRERVRFLNVVGVADVLNPLGVFVSGVNQYEDDGAVPLACARFNFLFQQSIKEDYPEGERIPLGAAGAIDMAPYVVANALHFTPVPEMTNFPGIAQIPQGCVRDERYPHPTFGYVWEHLLGRCVRQRDRNLGDYKTFLLDINVRLAPGDVSSRQKVQIDLRLPDGNFVEGSNIEILNPMELYAHGVRQSQRCPEQWRFYFTGNIKRRLDNRPEALLVKVQCPGYRSRMVEAEVRPAFSSFVDVNLVPAGGRR